MSQIIAKGFTKIDCKNNLKAMLASGECLCNIRYSEKYKYIKCSATVGLREYTYTYKYTGQ